MALSQIFSKGFNPTDNLNLANGWYGFLAAGRRNKRLSRRSRPACARRRCHGSKRRDSHLMQPTPSIPHGDEAMRQMPNSA